jgi:hypothetical protein
MKSGVILGGQALVWQEYDRGPHNDETSRPEVRLGWEVVAALDCPCLEAEAFGPDAKLPNLAQIESDTLYQAYRPAIQAMIDTEA